MSVTRIEAWLKNPYEIFARDILKLDKLPMLGADPDAALRGSVVHDIMSRFAAAFPRQPAGRRARGELMTMARAILADYDSHPRVAAFWLPRFQRFAAVVRRDRAGAARRRRQRHRRRSAAALSSPRQPVPSR